MRYSYIILISDRSNQATDLEIQYAQLLREMGLKLKASIGRLRLYASRQTPVLTTFGAIIIGDLYTPDGSALTLIPAFPHLITQEKIRRHLLRHYWGEYVLVQPDQDSDLGATIMRDPSGGMPCAYSLRADTVFVTSDISIAIKLGLYRAHVDWSFIAQCLVYPHVKTQLTGFVGIDELLPGCSLSIGGQRNPTTSEWSPWDFVTPSRRQTDPNIAATVIRDAVTSVVKALATTDGNLLVEVSGGLDSSIVAACLLGTAARIVCCTVVTPLPGADERYYANQMAQYLGKQLEHEELSLEGASISFPLPSYSLRPAIWALGHAVGSRMNAAADRHHIGSFFSGSGGDTVFCYLKTAAPAADAFKECGLAAGLRAIRDLSSLHDCTVTKAARLTARKLLAAPKAPWKPDHTFLTSTDTAAPQHHPWCSAPANYLWGDRERIFDLASNQMFRDATPRTGARRVRMPLLSQPVMEACLAVPSWMWIADGQNRAVARRAFDGILPSDILSRRSKGTFMNYTSAVYRRSKNSMLRFLLDGQLGSHGLLNARTLSLYMEHPLPPRDRSFMRVFDLCMIENWLRNQV